jgi:hypothetical protein
MCTSNYASIETMDILYIPIIINKVKQRIKNQDALVNTVQSILCEFKIVRY